MPNPTHAFHCWRWLPLAALLSVLAGCASPPATAPVAAPPSGPLTGWRTGQAAYTGGVVAASHPLAAEAGRAVLAAGGNAVDAAAAIHFALNVVEPQSSGIGGGGFMLLRLAAGGRTLILDSRETAPALATPDMFGQMDFQQASTSGLSVGVPGAVAGLEHALRHWGTMSLAQTLQPAIRLARDGFAVNADLAARSASPRAALQPETTARFRLPDGSPLPVGHRLVQPELAHTFELLARHGSAVFYRGEIADAIVTAQQRSLIGPAGVGRMTRDDLARYAPAVREPVVGTYRGYEIHSMPPPSSGGLSLLMMLKLLEPYPLGGSGDGWGFGGRNTLHVMAEAMRLTFADRAVWMGDADDAPVPTEALLSPCHIARRAPRIDLGRRMDTPPAEDPRPCLAGLTEGAGLSGTTGPEGRNTTHFSVVDRWGNLVSFTSTIESAWGSGILVPGYGFLLNNELTDFNLRPRRDAATGDPGINDVAPGKRPRSSMAPTLILRDGHPLVAYGSPGGSTIINSVLNTTLNLIDHRMDIDTAIRSPRFSVTTAEGMISCEPGLPAASIDSLARMGHRFPPGADPCRAEIGSVQAVILDPGSGRQSGGADPRREGTVYGLP
ncbi:MAG: gamma-glutamyltransferase [Rhodocyclaceae bacterium]|nr:gamma-glutamyltransferase [Rhodocyclaceae bacterium]